MVNSMYLFYLIIYWILLTIVLRVMINDSINRKFVLEIQVFTYFLTIITPLFYTNLLILIL